MRVLFAVAVTVVCLAAPPRAAADIYSFTDADGVTHYTNMPDDSRYALLIKAPPEPHLEHAPSAAVLHSDWHARAAAYSGMIDRVARTAEVHPALVRAVIAAESAFDPTAVSRAGAQGLMQLLSLIHI